MTRSLAEIAADIPPSWMNDLAKLNAFRKAAAAEKSDEPVKGEWRTARRYTRYGKPYTYRYRTRVKDD